MSIVSSYLSQLSVSVRGTEKNAPAFGSADIGDEPVFDTAIEKATEMNKTYLAPSAALAPSCEIPTEMFAEAKNTQSAVAAKEDSEKPDLREAFLEYLEKTPLERYFEAFLKSKGVTEDRYETLPPEEKQALLEEFEELMKRQVKLANGVDERTGGTEIDAFGNLRSMPDAARG